MNKKKVIAMAGLMALTLSACQNKHVDPEDIEETIPETTLSAEEVQAIQESQAKEEEVESIAQRFPQEFATVGFGDKSIKFPCNPSAIKDLGFTRADEFDHDVPAHGQASVKYKSEDLTEAYFTFSNDTDGPLPYDQCTCVGMFVDDSLVDFTKFTFFDGITMDSTPEYVKDRTDAFQGNRYYTSYYTYYGGDDGEQPSGLTVVEDPDGTLSAIYLTCYSETEYEYKPVDPPFDIENETFVQSEGDPDPTDFVVPEDDMYNRDHEEEESVSE